MNKVDKKFNELKEKIANNKEISDRVKVKLYEDIRKIERLNKKKEPFWFIFW